jgi:5-methylcytosine-specific restriction endonuclease McrA
MKTQNDFSHLRKLNDVELLSCTQELVKEERLLSIEILQHLMEVERRRLYATRGFPSLFEYCVRALGYSESAAQRRISSMRLLREIPEVEAKICDGKLSLSVISQAQSFFRQEAKCEKPLGLIEKKEVLLALEGKSHRDAERELVARAVAPRMVGKEKLRPLTKELTELKFVVDQETLGDIDKLKALLSHRNSNLDLAGLMRLLLNLGLEKWDPVRQVRKRTSLPAPAVDSKRKAIPATLKRAVWTRDNGQCTYRDPLHKTCCSSSKFLQIDHVVPLALGGTTELSNLRLLCFEHNHLAARQVFGAKKMEAHRGKIGP